VSEREVYAPQVDIATCLTWYSRYFTARIVKSSVTVIVIAVLNQTRENRLLLMDEGSSNPTKSSKRKSHVSIGLMINFSVVVIAGVLKISRRRRKPYLMHA